MYNTSSISIIKSIFFLFVCSNHFGFQLEDQSTTLKHFSIYIFEQLKYVKVIFCVKNWITLYIK